MKSSANYYIDITADFCPLTFVKTKLVVERMRSGETLEIRLKGAEPLRNVPRSLSELGHRIVSRVAEDGEGETGIHRLVVRIA